MKRKCASLDCPDKPVLLTADGVGVCQGCFDELAFEWAQMSQEEKEEYSITPPTN